MTRIGYNIIEIMIIFGGQKLYHFSKLLSILIFTNFIFPLYFCSDLFHAGISLRHGTHHVAQRSISTKDSVAFTNKTS